MIREMIILILRDARRQRREARVKPPDHFEDHYRAGSWRDFATHGQAADNGEAMDVTPTADFTTMSVI